MFRKSSFCAAMASVEVDTNFKKSSFCGVSFFCVEVDQTNDESVVAVRHSKAPETVIVFSCDEWETFIKGVKNGEFDIED